MTDSFQGGPLEETGNGKNECPGVVISFISWGSPWDVLKHVWFVLTWVFFWSLLNIFFQPSFILFYFHLLTCDLWYSALSLILALAHGILKHNFGLIICICTISVTLSPASLYYFVQWHVPSIYYLEYHYCVFLVLLNVFIVFIVNK